MSSVTEKSELSKTSSKPEHSELPRIAYVNERRLGKDHQSNSSTARPRHGAKVIKETRPVRHHSFLSDVPDVRHMEKALIGLLADFDSGKLRAFGEGCSMEQMISIREQQEQLAKLHFDLGSSLGTGSSPLSSEGLRHTQAAMSQLVQRLEQLSVSIEGLQSSDNSN